MYAPGPEDYFPCSGCGMWTHWTQADGGLCPVCVQERKDRRALMKGMSKTEMFKRLMMMGRERKADSEKAEGLEGQAHA